MGLPILRESTRLAGLASGRAGKRNHVTQLHFPQVPKKAAETDTFHKFKMSLMNVGKTTEHGNVSAFIKKNVIVFKETDILITCEGEPILIGEREERGRYRILRV